MELPIFEGVSSLKTAFKQHWKGIAEVGIEKHLTSFVMLQATAADLLALMIIACTFSNDPKASTLTWKKAWESSGGSQFEIKAIKIQPVKRGWLREKSYFGTHGEKEIPT